MWQKADSVKGLNWEQALAYAAQLRLAGHADWRLPHAKELQSIVDYTRAPSVTQSPAIDPVFQVTPLADGDFPFFWTGTTHLDGPPDRRGTAAVYVAFGRATGWMQPGSRFGGPGPGRPPAHPSHAAGDAAAWQLIDAHGAGAQRSDPKAGDPQEYPHGRGPQGDVVRITNHVRCVRGGASGDARPPAPLR
jgi:hypothetical protein